MAQSDPQCGHSCPTDGTNTRLGSSGNYEIASFYLTSGWINFNRSWSYLLMIRDRKWYSVSLLVISLSSVLPILPSFYFSWIYWKFFYLVLLKLILSNESIITYCIFATFLCIVPSKYGALQRKKKSSPQRQIVVIHFHNIYFSLRKEQRHNYPFLEEITGGMEDLKESLIRRKIML